MSDASDKMIDGLVKGLSPVKPLRAGPLWIGAGIAFGLAALYIFNAYGPRPEIRSLLRGGAWPSDNMFVLKPLLFLILGASALRAVADLARPQGRLRLWVLAPVIAIAGIVVCGLIRVIAAHGMAATFDDAFGQSTLCLMTIFCGGMAGLILLWRLWLRRTASSHPLALGAMSGLAASSFMAAAYAVHCNMDAPVYILLIYGLGVAVVTAISAVIGSRLLRW